MLKSSVNLSDRTEKLSKLQEQVHQSVTASGLMDGGNCHTVCEDHLVIVNGVLQHQLVCHTVCDE